jgi:hypothetical protein
MTNLIIFNCIKKKNLEQREDRVGSLMVCGPPASGKTAVVRALACGLRLPHALVDCSAQHVAQSLLFEDVLARLQPHVPAISISCSSPAKFVSALRAVCAGRAETTYIVLFLLSRLLTALLSPESHYAHAHAHAHAPPHTHTDLGQGGEAARGFGRSPSVAAATR